MVAQNAILLEDRTLIEKFGKKPVSVNQPYIALARAVLKGSVKSINNCPKTIIIADIRNVSSARTRLLRAIEALDWAHYQPDAYIFWCEVAEVGPDWLSGRMIGLAESKPLLLKAWEAQNA